jgi:hypothetical protein
VKPKLDEKGVKLYLVSIGTYERSKEFAKATGFPAENLFVDPETLTYQALGLAKGVRQTFFSMDTPMAIMKRIDGNALGDLKDVLGRWQPWNPPKPDQALNQGGMFVFDGEKCIFEHFDASTGAHADITEVLGLALPANCDCD